MAGRRLQCWRRAPGGALSYARCNSYSDKGEWPRIRRMLGRVTVAVTVALAGAVLSAQAPASTPPSPAPATPYKFSGLVFGDYYHFSQSHDPKWQGQQGFWLRRIFFTFDYTFTPKVSTRIRLEMNSDGKLAGGALTPYVRDAWLRWTFLGRQQMTLGIQPSLSIDFIDTFWGLRHVEKTPLDLYKWDSTRDTGVTVSGPINEANTLKYFLQFGNESGINAEVDAFKAVRVTARYEANPGLTVEGTYGHFARDRNADRTTAQVVAGYRAKHGRAGFQYHVPEAQRRGWQRVAGSRTRHLLRIRRGGPQGTEVLGVCARRPPR